MRFIVLLFGLVALAPAAPAQVAPFVTSNAVDGAALDAVRGGFAYGDSLLVTLGIERLVTVNGNVALQNVVQFGDIGKLANGQAQLASDALMPRLIQNGQAAEVTTSLPAGALGGTFIQNSLNDQLINNQTTIRASVNSAGMLQTMNFNASLNQALNNAISSR